MSLAAEPVRHRARRRAGIALDGDVHVVRVRAAQQIAHPAAHEKGRRQPLERGQQPLHARQAPDALTQLWARAGHHRRTGIPAARILSFASRTVC